MEAILKQLKESFDLNENHTQIIQLLQFKKHGAKSIAKETEIPIGKIYEHLNFLLKHKIIERTNKKPFIYSINNLNGNIIGFMKHKIDDMQKVQNNVMDMMDRSGIEDIQRINNSKKFTEVHLSMINEAKCFKYITAHRSVPYILYPYDFSKFMQLRNVISNSRPTITAGGEYQAMLVFKSYLEAMKQGKEILVVIEKGSLEYYVDTIKKKMGKKFFEYWKKTILEQFDKYNIKCFVVDEYTPMQIDINERRVTVSLRHLGLTTGIVISSKEASQLYNNIFNQHMKRGKDIVQIIKKL